MSPWERKEYSYAAEGMPHVTKIARKPKGIGCELKSAADGMTGILLRLEIQEGADAMAKKKFADIHKYHTAVTLRLVEPWFGSNRIIVGDSAFASFATVIALLMVGLFFRGIVKTCSTLFPMKWFKRWGSTNPPRGSNVQLLTNVMVRGVSRVIMAVGWMCKLPKYFISSCGNGLPAEAQHAQRSKRVLDDEGLWTTFNYVKNTDWPSVVKNLYRYFSVIDIHDHYRQGILALEIYNKTKTWWHRVMSTVLGMIFTDAYFMYRYEYLLTHLDLDGIETFEEWLGKLAFQMINNPYLEGSSSRHGRRSSSEIPTVRKHFLVFCLSLFLNTNDNSYFLFFILKCSIDNTH